MWVQLFQHNVVSTIVLQFNSKTKSRKQLQNKINQNLSMSKVISKRLKENKYIYYVLNFIICQKYYRKHAFKLIF